MCASLSVPSGDGLEARLAGLEARVARLGALVGESVHTPKG